MLNQLILQYLVRKERSCAIDGNKSITARNLKYYCNTKQLKRIFSNLTAGTFPPNGQLKGSILLDGLQDQNIWNGKNMKRRGGNVPHDRGTLTNMIFSKSEMFDADIYRTKAPIDGKQAFALNYKRDKFVFFIVDYIREIQTNLYLGIMTLRPFHKSPVLYFLLEKI